MLELEEKVAASTQAAQFERERSLRLEEDLRKMNDHLVNIKKESAANKQAAEKALKESSACLEACRKGIRAMTQRIFGNHLLCSLSFNHNFFETFLTL